jgi:hypothetical protein
MRWLVTCLLVLGLLALGLRHLPPQWDPRVPLDLTAPPNALTGMKLWWMTSRPDACAAAFASPGIRLDRVPDRASKVGCGIENAVRLASGLRMAPPHSVVTCLLAAAWVLFERHTVQPAARRHLGTEVATVRHPGIYACRNVNHAERGFRSERATANAIDVAGFVLRDGREVRLAQAWRAGGEAAFLLAVRDGACRWFHTVLSPDYNAAHRDHFHLDIGSGRICR